MAIERYDVNGDFAALKSALEATEIFASVVFNESETQDTIFCYDSEEHLLFKVQFPIRLGSQDGWSFTAYKSDGTTVAGSGIGTSTTSYGSPTYLYKVGSSGILIHFNNSASHAAVMVIGKTNTDHIGFIFPSTGITNSSGNDETVSINVCAWDDEGTKTTSLRITNAPPGMIGNSTLLVPVPLHGSYGVQENFRNVFFIPMAQEGMRGVVQEIIGSNNKTYLTNGYLAVLDV